jgi:hypothetical protein
MHSRNLAFVLLPTALAAQSPEIYSNGPIQTGTNGLGPISVLQSAAPTSLTVFGFGAQAAVPNRCLDQFAVNTMMLLDGIEVFGYATGVLTPNCTAVQLSLFNGDPSTGTPTQLLPGAGNGINLMTTPGYTVSNTMTGIFRVQDIAATTGNRPIQSIRVNFAQLTLNPGIYYLQFAFTGPNFSPPITTLNQQVTGDGFQFLNAPTAPIPPVHGTNPGYYNAVAGAGFGQGMAFKLYGAPVTAPGAITNLGGGCSTATFNVQGSPAVGGYFLAELGSVNPLGLGVIAIGFSNPNSSLFPFCTCVNHASLDVLIVGNTFSLQIPPNATLVGADVFAQGGTIDIANLGGVSACNVGLQFDLTNGFQVHLY